MRASDDEFPGRVYMEYVAVFEECCGLLRKGADKARKKYVLDILPDYPLHFRIIVLDEFVMLGRYHYGMYAQRFPVFRIFDGELGLGVRAEVFHLVAFPPDLRQDAKCLMRQGYRQRHVLGGFRAGVTEHHALVSGTLFLLIPGYDTPVDVGALFMQGREYSA